MLAQQMSPTSHTSADTFGEQVHSLTRSLQRYGLPSDSLEVSLPTTPRLYLGASGLQTMRPLPKSLELDTSHVRLQSTPDWMRTPSPSAGRRHLPPRAWAESPSSSLGGRSSYSRSSRSQKAPVNSLPDIEEQKSKNGLRQLLERQNTWRRQHESLKQRKSTRSLPRPQLSSDARREIMRKLPAKRDGASLKQRAPGPARVGAMGEAAEEVGEKKEVPIWHASFRKEPTEFEKAVIVAKSYNFPLQEVKARLDKFRKLKKGQDVITIGRFCEVVKEEYMLEEESLLESFLKAGKFDEHQTLDFETFLLWSMKTDFLEEMLVTDPQERHFRSVIREHGIKPGDIDKIRSAYDSFDPNGNGAIRKFLYECADSSCDGTSRLHNEFRSLLCKLRKVDAEGDIPEPEFKRCWHTGFSPEKEEQVINFEQFLLQILKSGELDR